MNLSIRKAENGDKEVFVDFALKLSVFTRGNHDEQCKYDDYANILKAIRKKAEETFLNRNDNTLILIAELGESPVGYLLGRIFQEEVTADNGTGRMGLLDELYIEKSAIGNGLGQKLIDEMMSWMKEKGIYRVKLQVYAWNQSAIKIYENNGFAPYVLGMEKYL